MRVRTLPTVLLALILAVFAVPASAQDNGEEVVVRVALHADEQNLNPFVTPNAQPFSHDLTMLVYDTLFWSQSQLNPEPWLAIGAEPSDDFRTWTVELRSGVQWHDGEAFTADDVAFTFQYFSDIGGPGRYGRHVYDHPVFESANVIDDTTIELSFVEPIATFRLLPGGDLPMLPQHIWEGVTDPRADVTTLPIGTGPFKMADFQPDTSYRLEANDAYFIEAPMIDALELLVIPDRSDAFEALEKGEIDLVARNIPTELNDEIGANEDLEIVGSSRNQTVYLSFNLDSPGLDDLQVRRAISLALDSDLMLDTVEGGNGRLATATWTNPNSPWTRDPEAVRLSDLLAANQLLDSAEYAPGDDDVREGPGGPLSFSLGVKASDPNQLHAAELVVEQLEPLGVAVTIETFDSSAIDAAQGLTGGPALDMVIDELESNSQDDPDHLYFLFHSSSGGRSGGALFGNYANPDFDAAIEDALGEQEGSRRPKTHQAQDILAEDIPVVVLYYPAGRTAYRPAGYDGWWSDPGHGVFHKRAFLASYADDGSADDDSGSGLTPISLQDTGGGGWRIFAGATALAAGAVGFGLWRRRSVAEAAAE